MWFFKSYFTALRVLSLKRQVATAPPGSPACWERVRRVKRTKSHDGYEYMGTWIWTDDTHFFEFVILKCPLLDNVEQFNTLQNESNDDSEESERPHGA